jgi:hypothetical protein
MSTSVPIQTSAPSSHTLSMYVPPFMSETKFHTHTKPQAKVIVLYILILEDFRQQTRRKMVWPEVQPELPEFFLLLISSRVKFWFITVVPNYFNCITFSKILTTTYFYVMVLPCILAMRRQYTVHDLIATKDRFLFYDSIYHTLRYSMWLQFRVHYCTQILMFTVTYLLPLLGSGFNGGRFPSSGFPNYPRPQLPSYRNIPQWLNSSSSLD